MIKKLGTAGLFLFALTLLGASSAAAESSRHFRHDGIDRTFTATDPSGQLKVQWTYSGDQGDWAREDGEDDWFYKAQDNDAAIVVFVNIAGTFTPVGEGHGNLNVTSTAVQTSPTTYAITDERFNLQSHGVVETFAGTWDLHVSVIVRDGEFIRLFISPPPF